MSFRACFAAALCMGAFSGAALAQDYPTKPVTVIVPFAAGGPTDVAARIYGEFFARTLGQAFVIENAAGAGGTTGITRSRDDALRDAHGSFFYLRRPDGGRGTDAASAAPPAPTSGFRSEALHSSRQGFNIRNP